MPARKEGDYIQIEEITPDELSRSRVKDISFGLVYYVHTGRNAWHSTWITKYDVGCMHTTIESAKSFAERRRTSGTVFCIKQLPCLVFRCAKGTLFVTEINNSNPLSGYSIMAPTDSVNCGYEKPKGELDSYLVIGAPIHGVARSFLFYGTFWNEHPSPQNSVITLFSLDKTIHVENSNASTLLAYKSFSSGGRYYLGWRKADFGIEKTAISDLYNKATKAKKG